MEDALEFLLAQVARRARAADGPPPEPAPAQPPPQVRRRYPPPIVRRPRPAPGPPVQPPPPAPPVLTTPSLPPAPPPAAAPKRNAGLLAAFGSREALLGALVFAEALGPPPSLRPRNPGGGF